MVSVEVCVLPGWVTEQVAKQVNKKAGLPRDHLVICCTHTHTGPCLKGALPTMFGEPLPAGHQAHIDRYTDRLVSLLERVALEALANRRPASLTWGQGKAAFAMNRRQPGPAGAIRLSVNPGGPVDHALPVLRVATGDGKLLAIVANYACHCTTLGGDFNKLCGDWAGYAQQYIEADQPGATCLITIGCGGDANPEPRTGLDLAKRHGREVADEVRRLLQTDLVPLAGPPSCRLERIKLPFDRIPGRREWEERAKQSDYAGYQAKRIVEQLNGGQALPTELPYSVQTWSFGHQLAMVFLPGEVVVDYALRFKREFDADRMWITAYANDVPCYIPSRRVLAEGGYEPVSSMIFYDRPSRLAPEVEDLIAAAVHRLVPPEFNSRSPQGESR